MYHGEYLMDAVEQRYYQTTKYIPTLLVSSECLLCVVRIKIEIRSVIIDISSIVFRSIHWTNQTTNTFSCNSSDVFSVSYYFFVFQLCVDGAFGVFDLCCYSCHW